MKQTNTEFSILVFIPNDKLYENGVLCGEIVFNRFLNTKHYVIHEIKTVCSDVPKNIIGVIGNVPNCTQNPKFQHWLELKPINLDYKFPEVNRVISDNKVLNQEEYQIVFYDKLSFTKCELLLQNSDCENVDDHFKLLLNGIRHKQFNENHDLLHMPKSAILPKLIYLFILIDTCMTRHLFTFKFSVLAMHFHSFIKHAIWGLEVIQINKGFRTLDCRNYILGLVGDWFGGLFLIYWYVNLASVEKVLQEIASQSEVIIIFLKEMVHYLMGSPVDLKLNSPLNNVLGNFFLFHIELWWSFLGFSRPLLELGFHTFILLGSLGLSFQIAILADLLAMASFHVYIIYVYAARLYHAQITGLLTLSRLFLGRKRNPVAGRVDSCPYTTDQLLIGTIAFTVLLFLLPTTLVYYIVFTAIRLLLIAVGGILTRIKFILAALPIYSTTLWFFNSPVTSSCVKLTPHSVPSGDCVLVAEIAQGSLWDTVRAYRPPVTAPLPTDWNQLFWNLVTGRLIYPV